LNQERIQVSKVSLLGASLLATGFPYDIRTSEQNNLSYFREFALTAQAVRRVGSAALDLCYVGCGRFDGFWELKLNPWDCAAGCLVVQEGGGRVTDFSGQPSSIYGGEFVASNGIIHDEMLAVIQSV
jgi:myo-inositol-1(or 4)-monophosphatase